MASTLVLFCLWRSCQSVGLYIFPTPTGEDGKFVQKLQSWLKIKYKADESTTHTASLWTLPILPMCRPWDHVTLCILFMSLICIYISLFVCICPAAESCCFTDTNLVFSTIVLFSPSNRKHVCICLHPVSFLCLHPLQSVKASRAYSFLPTHHFSL